MIDHIHYHWSFAEKTFVKQSMMLCAFEILLKIGRFGGGVNRTGDLGVNRTWRFEGKSSVRFTPPRNRHVRFGHMGLFIWHLVPSTIYPQITCTIYPPQIVMSDLVTWDSIWHLVSRVFWVKFLFLSQHLKREVGFFNFTTLLLIIYSLLQYNIHLCEIYCCKCSKVALTFY